MTLDEQIAFCEEKSKNIKLKAEPQVFIDIKECLEELKEIRGCISEIGKYIGKEKSTSYRWGYTEGIKAAKGEQWISVEDRLPENDATVLCLAYNHCITIEPFYALGFYSNGAWRVAGTEVRKLAVDKFKNIFYVSYWMPLSEKPKAGKK